ncbi:MAG: glycosyltransferase family 4 protein [Synechococcales cyanobacterium RM1_1_8]|nr:glycosyltransferase family 4 protein [Synechococcales cyanobacterium RM1_1_8]
MRILLYAYNYYPEPIGIAPLMTELAEGLARRGHEVRVVTGMPNYPERQVYPDYRGKAYVTEERNGVTIQRSYMWVRQNPSLMDRILLDGSFVATSLVQALRGWRPDLLMLTAPPLPVSVPAAMLGVIYRCPVVLNLQDILPDAAIHLGILTNPAVIRIFEALEKFAYRSATAISVITDKFTENLNGKGIESEKISCIPNWVDVNFIKPLPRQDNDFRRELGLEDKFVALYSGNIAHSQGIETVLRAAALLAHRPEIHFVIAGAAKAVTALEVWCGENGIGLDNIHLMALQPRDRLPSLLAAADVGLIIQKRNVVAFNMPSKTQVLMASGRPIIASVPGDGPAADALLDSQAGLVVAPEQPEALAQAVVQLQENPGEARAMGDRGRRYALEHYSFEQALNRYESLFTSLIPDGQMASLPRTVTSLPEMR